MLIASQPPAIPDPRIDFIRIHEMDIREYSRFVLQDLHTYIETSHVLIVQADGFVLNPGLWNPGWLDYDYVGAPWPETLRVGKYVIPLANRVGNGGFSLRSRRLLKMTAPIDLSTLRFPTRAEDVITCHLLFDYLTQYGIRFADLNTAASFAIESRKATLGHTLDTSFGFHGREFLADVASRAAYPA